MDSSISSTSMASSTYDGAGAEEQDQERQQQREAKRYRISSSNHTTTSDNSNNSNSSGSGGGDDNSTIASQQSSLSLTFQTPLGLEDRFQKLLTLQETVDDEVDDHDLEVVTQSEVDSLLYAKDMYELSPAEREQVLWDIHGVAAQVVSNDDDDNSVETDEFINEKRQVLQQCLLQSNTHGTHAYSQALCQNASYVQSPHVQLPFLRCHAWNPQEACDKLLAFFTLKLQLFGSAKLCRDIGISDLSSSNKEDRKMLDSGFFQLLPQRDVAGRAILVAMPMCSYDNMSIVSLMRAFYYMYMTAAQDVETQRNGLILMGCNVGPRRRVNRKIAWHVHKVRQALPLKTMGIHYCYDDLRMLPMMTIAMLVSSASSRVRFRAHHGTVPELHHTLTTYGIPDQCLPVTNEGEPKTKSFRAWVKSRKQQEDDDANADSNKKIVIVPGRLDVLLGRGKPIQEHFGNLRYHVLLDHYQQQYEGSKKFEKMQVSQTIVDLVHHYKGRFLKQEGACGWSEVDPLVARDKVSHAFRTRRTSSSNQQQQQQAQSTTGSSAAMKRPNEME